MYTHVGSNPNIERKVGYIMTPLEELFDGFDGDAEDYKVIIDWGLPQGEEIW